MLLAIEVLFILANHFCLAIMDTILAIKEFLIKIYCGCSEKSDDEKKHKEENKISTIKLLESPYHDCPHINGGKTPFNTPINIAGKRKLDAIYNNTNPFYNNNPYMNLNDEHNAYTNFDDDSVTMYHHD